MLRDGVETADWRLEAASARGGEKKILGYWRAVLPPANTPNPEFVKTLACSFTVIGEGIGQ
jgi:hypothetical protein